MKGARYCALLLWVSAAVPLAAQGHGPVYGLSTPTLGRGGWSLDVAAMARWADGAGTSSMLRPMLAYGITEDVQLSVSVPVPLGTAERMMPARGTTRMPASRDLEALLAWRFQRGGRGPRARDREGRARARGVAVAAAYGTLPLLEPMGD